MKRLILHIRSVGSDEINKELVATGSVGELKDLIRDLDLVWVLEEDIWGASVAYKGGGSPRVEIVKVSIEDIRREYLPFRLNMLRRYVGKEGKD